ncbi:MAG: SWIM zinc finger family protein [Pleurocapsa sp.]
MTNFQVENREWWVERWLELLNSYRFKKRLERGRNYAREGNVLSIDFTESQALAKVQGSEAEPYQVSLSLDSFTDEDWQYAIATMSEKAIFSAQLLAGEMPDKIEEVFTANGLSLFPFSLGDVRSRCSCPDKANPCKHIAAVYYQLGDRFSEDPFVIFQLRGRTKNQILDSLRQIRSQQAITEAVESSSETQVTTPAAKTSTTSPDTQDFWQYDEPLEASLVAIAPPLESKTILDLLGRIPLPPADADAMQQYLTQVYQTATQRGIMSALNP